MTPEGYLKLLEHEGEVFHAYKDSLGYLTIGVGHCIDERKGCGITKDISRRMLDDDIARATAGCRGAFSWFDDLDPVRQDVIIMLAFNMGIDHLKAFRLMSAAIEQKRWSEAAYQLANSLWGRQVGLDRKRSLCDALESGKW